MNPNQRVSPNLKIEKNHGSWFLEVTLLYFSTKSWCGLTIAIPRESEVV